MHEDKLNKFADDGCQFLYEKWLSIGGRELDSDEFFELNSLLTRFFAAADSEEAPEKDEEE